MNSPCTRTAVWRACLLVSFGLVNPALGAETQPMRVTGSPPTPTVPAATALSLADLERMALQATPTLAQSV